MPHIIKATGCMIIWVTYVARIGRLKEPMHDFSGKM